MIYTLKHINTVYRITQAYNIKTVTGLILLDGLDKSCKTKLFQAIVWSVFQMFKEGNL
jgi:hypothetical protein